MGKWGKWVLLFVVAMVFAVPAWAVDLKLGGKYEIQGRYYNEADIQSVDTGADRTPVTTMYLKHYFNLYPTIVVNDKISVKGDLEVFDNIMSDKDSYGYADKSSTYAWQGTSDADNGVNGKELDQYSLFTVNELYVDATTQVGKFIVGKTKAFTGIGWFIQTPAVPDWTFGLIYNKKDENNNKNSYLGYDPDLRRDGSDTAQWTNHDNADETHYYAIANYAQGPIDFKGTVVYKHTGAESTRTRVWYPFAYFNYAITKDLTFNSKFGFATGPLFDKKSPVAGGVPEAIGNGIQDNADALIAKLDPADPDSAALATAIQGQATALRTAIVAAYPDGLKEDWEVDSMFGVWLGMGYKMDALKIQGDVAWMPGADAPNKVSAYLEDNEGLDTWLMNDVADANALKLQTPATISALGDPRWDGNYSFANCILVRLNLGYQFTPKLDANLNLVWGKMENTDYLENWNVANTINNVPPEVYVAMNAVDPDALKAGSTGAAPFFAAAPAGGYDVSDGLGWEARARVNYALMDNLSTGLDLCYYQPGDLYKDLIESAFVDGTNTNRSLENTYAARWRMTVKF